VIINKYKNQNVRVCVMGIPSKEDEILEKESVTYDIDIVVNGAKYH